MRAFSYAIPVYENLIFRGDIFLGPKILSALWGEGRDNGAPNLGEIAASVFFFSMQACELFHSAACKRLQYYERL